MAFYSVDGYWQFTIFGVGIYWKNTLRYKYGMSFSERNRYKKFLKIGSWIIGIVRNTPNPYVKDAPFCEKRLQEQRDMNESIS